METPYLGVHQTGSRPGYSFADAYPQILEAVGALEPSSRGSGTKTAIVAAFAASLANTSDPRSELLIIINALGSDTDSIATMFGAIVGACTNSECNGAIQDRAYIRAEAARLTSVAAGRKTAYFRYPDLRSWKPARAAIDAIGSLDGNLWLSGLGGLTVCGELSKAGNDLMGWCELPFGQTILAKIRPNPNPMSSAQAGATPPEARPLDRNSAAPPSKLRDLFGQGDARTEEKPSAANPRQNAAEGTLNDVLQRVISEGFPPELIGQVLLNQVENGNRDFVERGIALTAKLASALVV